MLAREHERCSWGNSHPLYVAYHDEEWGVPLHNDTRLFEMLVLESAQAGLSWLTILKKRHYYRYAFSNFNARKIARYDSKKIKQLLANEKIIRNKLKIKGTIQNARAFLEIQDQYETFDQYIWKFINGKPRQNFWSHIDEIPAYTLESSTMAKDLKHHGFNFIGPTICYAFMQATGMVNDHLVDCFRHRIICTLG